MCICLVDATYSWYHLQKSGINEEYAAEILAISVGEVVLGKKFCCGFVVLGKLKWRLPKQKKGHWEMEEEVG